MKQFINSPTQDAGLFAMLSYEYPRYNVCFVPFESVSELMKDAGFTDVEVYKDLAGLDRVVSGTYQG